MKKERSTLSPLALICGYKFSSSIVELTMSTSRTRWPGDPTEAPSYSFTLLQTFVVFNTLSTNEVWLLSTPGRGEQWQQSECDKNSFTLYWEGIEEQTNHDGSKTRMWKTELNKGICKDLARVYIYTQASGPEFSQYFQHQEFCWFSYKKIKSMD